VPEGREIRVRAEFLNLAGGSWPEEGYLSGLADFCSHVKASALHATFGAFEYRGIYFFSPVPPILSPNLLPSSIDRIQKIQSRFGLPLAVRNCFDPSLNLPTLMPAVDFFYELTSRSGCGFICDVAAALSFARAFGEDGPKTLRRMLEIDGARAFVRDAEEAGLVKSLGFSGPLMSFERSLPGLAMVCEGEFDE
jgi:hypothetical protein